MAQVATSVIAKAGQRRQFPHRRTRAARCFHARGLLRRATANRQDRHRLRRRNEVMPAAAEIEAKNFEVTRGLLRKAGELGLLGVDVPEAYGGLEIDKVTSAIVAEKISQLGSFSVAFSAHVGIGTLPLVWYGTTRRSRNICPSWPPASGSPPTRCRNRRPVPTP